MKSAYIRYIIILLFFSLTRHNIFAAENSKEKEITLRYKNKPDITTTLSTLCISEYFKNMIGDFGESNNIITIQENLIPYDDIKMLLPLMEALAKSPDFDAKQTKIDDFYLKNNLYAPSLLNTCDILAINTSAKSDLSDILLSKIIPNSQAQLLTALNKNRHEKYLKKLETQIKNDDIYKKITDNMISVETITKSALLSPNRKYELQLSDNGISIIPRSNESVIYNIPCTSGTAIITKSTTTEYPTFMFSPDDKFLLYCDKEIPVNNIPDDQRRIKVWNCTLINLLNGNKKILENLIWCDIIAKNDRHSTSASYRLCSNFSSDGKYLKIYTYNNDKNEKKINIISLLQSQKIIYTIDDQADRIINIIFQPNDTLSISNNDPGLLDRRTSISIINLLAPNEDPIVLAENRTSCRLVHIKDVLLCSSDTTINKPLGCIITLYNTKNKTKKTMYFPSKKKSLVSNYYGHKGIDLTKSFCDNDNFLIYTENDNNQYNTSYTDLWLYNVKKQLFTPIVLPHSLLAVKDITFNYTKDKILISGINQNDKQEVVYYDYSNPSDCINLFCIENNNQKYITDFTFDATDKYIVSEHSYYDIENKSFSLLPKRPECIPLTFNNYKVVGPSILTLHPSKPIAFITTSYSYFHDSTLTIYDLKKKIAQSYIISPTHYTIGGTLTKDTNYLLINTRQNLCCPTTEKEAKLSIAKIINLDTMKEVTIFNEKDTIELIKNKIIIHTGNNKKPQVDPLTDTRISFTESDIQKTTSEPTRSDSPYNHRNFFYVGAAFFLFFICAMYINQSNLTTKLLI